MSNKKKIISILVVPMLCLTSLLSGCSKTPTISKVQSEFDKMKNSYTVEDGDQSYNYLFGLNSSVDENTAETVYTPTNSIDITYDFDYDYKQSLYNKDSNNVYTTPRSIEYFVNQYTTKSSEEKVRNYNYYTIFVLQQYVLDLTFNYYENWQEHFFKVGKSLKISEEEIEQFNQSFYDLKDQLKSFELDRQSFENNVNTLSYNNVITSIQERYALSVNNLIYKSLNFVNTFENLNSKYIYNIDDVLAQKDGKYIYDQEVVELNLQNKFDQFYLNIANVMYYQNLKSLENGSADVSKILSEFDASSKDFMIGNYQTFSDTKTSNYIDCKAMFTTFKDDKILADDNTDAGKLLTARQALDMYLDNLNVFNQKLKVYLNCIDKIDFNSYFLTKINVSNNVFYENTLTFEEKSYINLIDDFIGNTYKNYVKSFNHFNQYFWIQFETVEDVTEA